MLLGLCEKSDAEGVWGPSSCLLFYCINLRVYFWASTVLLLQLCSITWKSEMCSFLLCSFCSGLIALAIWGLSWFHLNFRIVSFCEGCSLYLNRDCIKTISRIKNVTYAHPGTGMSFHFLMFSLISFFSVLWLSLSLVWLIPGNFFSDFLPPGLASRSEKLLAF